MDKVVDKLCNYMVIEWQFIIFGALGAILKDILDDGGLSLPRFENGKVILGFLGSALIGSVVGCIADNDPLTSIGAGFTSYAIIEQMLIGKRGTETPQTKTTEEQIREVATLAGVDANLAIRVAKCESSLKIKAVNINTDGSMDRGIFQINNKYHPEVSDEDAFDITKATQFFCTALKGGKLSWWDASKDCWNK